MTKNTMIYIVIILLLFVIILSSNNKDKNDTFKNIENTKYIENIYNPEYTIKIDDTSYVTECKTSVDTINLYPDYYPYTFDYKPYYYRLYPYPLRPQYHYHKKAVLISDHKPS